MSIHQKFQFSKFPFCVYFSKRPLFSEKEREHKKKKTLNKRFYAVLNGNRPSCHVGFAEYQTSYKMRK